MRHQKRCVTPSQNPERDRAEDRQEQPRREMPLMSCWQLTLALRAAGFGWDEIS